MQHQEAGGGSEQGGLPEIRTLLSRNKASLLRELESTNLLGALLKRGVITELDRQALASSSAASTDVDLFIDLIQAKGFEAFREFCFALEAEAPHVLTDLLVVQHALTEEQERQHQHQKQASQSVSVNQEAAPAAVASSAVPPPPPPHSKPVDKHNEYSSSAAADKEKTSTLRRPVVLGRRSVSPPPPPPTPPPPPQPPPPSSTSTSSQHNHRNHHQQQKESAYSGLGIVVGNSEPILELLDEPVDELVGGSERGWEVHHVTVTRVPGYGFGIAVSGGRDNPHFTNGDPAIAISDVLKAGPAEGKLQVNDRIISANGVSLEGADYGAAVRVLRDSGSTVLLVVKRRAGTTVSPASPKSASPSHLHQQQQQQFQQQQTGSPLMGPGGALPAIGGSPIHSQTHRLSLTRPSKKDDFGIVLGCRLYIREVTREGTGAKVGDLVTRIAGVSADNMSLKEARKLMDQSKERLSLVVSREPLSDSSDSSLQQQLYQQQPLQLQQTPGKGQQTQQPDYQSSPAYSSQNLYVPPPTRQQQPPLSASIDDKSNLAPRGRSRGPLMDVSLSQLDLPATPTQSQAIEPPRPPPPRPEDYYSSRRQMYEEDPLLQRTGKQQQQQPMPDPRFITFQKEGSVGVRLTGGNETGVFVTAVQPGSPAALQGLQPGDKILKVNDMDMKGVTREEAVLFLLSLQEQIDLIVQHRRHEYEQIVASGKGDSFHVKTHFHYENPEKGEMSFRSGDVFHVVDTLHNGVVGSWQVYRIGRNNQEVQKGIIPNKARGEELATAQFNATKKEMSANESRGSFFRRRRGSHRRSKSLGRDHWDDVVFSDSVSKFPAYERVVLRHPGFIRPVVLFGPVADLAREKLLKDFPDKFTSPQTESQIEEGSGKSTKTSGIIRLSAIREVMDRGKHALLDITPNAVDRLNYAQFYPIVIFLKAETKQVIKEMRAGIPKSAHKSSKKLLEQCQKLDKIWGHVFSAVITLTSPESWYRKLRELIDWQQQGPLWMSQTKPEEALSDDFLFPMTSRLSYASSPESDLELSSAPPLPGALGVPSRLKSSSDPSIATQDDAVAPPPYTSSYQVSQLLQSLGNEQHFVTEPVLQQQQQAFEQHRRRSQHQHQMQQQQLQLQQQAPPDLPPRLDRNNKPTSPAARMGTLGRSAQERLINKTDSVLEMANYINATPHRANASSLERTQAKAGSYDSMSSYDSFNTNGVSYSTGNTSTGRLGPNVPDDLKSSSMAGTARPHDPYRFTRSTAIPVQETQLRTDYAKYSRAGDYKPVPAPPGSGKPSGTYKPVPPPKPKNYRPPQQAIIQDENGGGANLYQHAKSYSMGTSSHMYNGAVENGGVSAQRNSGQYYYNISPPSRNMQNDNYSMSGGGGGGSSHAHNHASPASMSHNHGMSHAMSSPPMTSHSHSNSSGQIGVAHNRNNTLAMNGHSHSNSHSGVTHQNSTAANNNHNRESSGLDLAGSREQRGSAFELYRKPLHHHNMRTKGMARGTFGSEGGVLEGPGGVTLIIPPGALSPNTLQELYFSVTDANAIELQSDTRGPRSSLSPPIHNGESMLSPLVECGPKGLEFRNPVELRIPHKATPAHRLALNATDTEDNTSTDWLNVKLPGPTSDHIIVRLDHF